MRIFSGAPKRLSGRRGERSVFRGDAQLSRSFKGPFLAAFHAQDAPRASSANSCRLASTRLASPDRVPAGLISWPNLVAGLAVTDQVLHNMERMLHLCSHAGIELFRLLRQLCPLGLRVQSLALAWLHLDVPDRALGLPALVHASVARVVKRDGLLALLCTRFP